MDIIDNVIIAADDLLEDDLAVIVRETPPVALVKFPVLSLVAGLASQAALSEHAGEGNTHDQIDTHMADTTKHFTQGQIDHANLLNKGTKTHTQIDTLFYPPTLSSPLLLNGWQNYGGGWAGATFCKSEGGLVTLGGLVAGGSAPSVIFVLPADYRPSSVLMFAVWATSAGGRVDVLSNGDVIFRTGVTTFVSLNFSFYA